MKGLLSKIRISRKIVLAFGGVLVLCGATGAAAVFIGADKILGPSYSTLNGFECTEVKTVTIKTKDRFWVRKYITTSTPGDGITRVKTALRVAGAVYQTEKPDLVQVVVLDKNGPIDRSAMRGRAVGADIIYIPDPSRVPQGASGQVFTARYVDRPANADGLFYGERIAMLEADIETLVARLDDKTDCVRPEVAVPEGQDPSAGHEKASTAAHEVAPADGHATAPADEHADESAAVPAVAEVKTEDTGYAANAASAHAAPTSEGDAQEIMAPQGVAAEDAHAKPAEPAGDGWLSSLKSMVLGTGEEKPVAQIPGDAGAADQIKAAPEEQDAAAPAVETEAAVEGDAAPAQTAATEEPKAAPEPEAEGKAKSAGAAWLEKLRSQPLEGVNQGAATQQPSADAHAAEGSGKRPAAEIPAEESLVLPPKASAKAAEEKHAEATH